MKKREMAFEIELEHPHHSKSKHTKKHHGHEHHESHAHKGHKKHEDYEKGLKCAKDAEHHFEMAKKHYEHAIRLHKEEKGEKKHHAKPAHHKHHESPAKHEKVAKVMHEYKEGKLPMGKSKKMVHNRKQAVAIAMHEAGIKKHKRKKKKD